MKKKRLSQKLIDWRAERPDEWKMDEFIRDAMTLESEADDEVEDAFQEGYAHGYSDGFMNGFSTQ